MITPGIDLDTGRVLVTRRQLARLIAHRAGRVAEDSAELVDLADHGFVDNGSIHPALTGPLDVMRSSGARLSLRRWHGGVPRPTIEVLIAMAGTVMLASTNDSDDVQELVWRPRPTSIARTVASLLHTPTIDAAPPFEPGTQQWDDLVAAATDVESGIELADLRLAEPVTAPLASILVICWRRTGGIAQLTRPAVDEHDVQPVDPQGVELTALHPVELWSQLTVLSSRALAMRPPRHD